MDALKKGIHTMLLVILILGAMLMGRYVFAPVKEVEAAEGKYSMQCVGALVGIRCAILDTNSGKVTSQYVGQGN